MQIKDKKGGLGWALLGLCMRSPPFKGRKNPMFGNVKSPTTIAKLQKLVSIYEA
jgi:hypothetical protein